MTVMTETTETIRGLAKPLKFRAPGHDRYIIKRVVEDNMYGLPDDMTGQLVIDIGAHVGSFSCLAASRGANVLAFEPELDNYRLLAENARGYDGIDRFRVRAHRLAIVGEPRDEIQRLEERPLKQKVILHVHPKNSGCHSISRMDWKPADFDPVAEEHVDAVTLAQVFDALRFPLYPSIRVAFLKMDCEGAEEGIVRDILTPLFGMVPRIDRMGVEFHSKDEISWAVPALEEHFYASPVSDWEWQFKKRAA